MSHELATSLIERYQTDQDMRNKFIKEHDTVQWDSSIDTDNTAWLEIVVDEVGWPTISAVGEEASNAAWLLVQHADHQPDFQVRCLELMKSLPSGEVKLSNIAYLEDRVRVAKNLPQIYGTQFIKVDGHFVAQPIENEAELEQRRAAMGLETFEANKQRMLETYGQ